MEYFLPIAQVEINLLFIFGLSLVVGILSGLFGGGGGFLMTPFLIFLGVPPIYAVPNEASNILGTSVSGSTTHYLKGTLDYKMGFMIVIGGIVGTVLGIITFSYFKDIGKINVVIFFIPCSFFLKSATSAFAIFFLVTLLFSFSISHFPSHFHHHSLLKHTKPDHLIRC